MMMMSGLRAACEKLFTGASSGRRRKKRRFRMVIGLKRWLVHGMTQAFFLLMHAWCSPLLTRMFLFGVAGRDRGGKMGRDRGAQPFDHALHAGFGGQVL